MPRVADLLRRAALRNFVPLGDIALAARTARVRLLNLARPTARTLFFKHVRRRPSGDVGNARLSVCLSRRLGLCRQLQHRRVLTLAQPGEQHDLPVGEL